jgi:hypothetical protein
MVASGVSFIPALRLCLEVNGVHAANADGLTAQLPIEWADGLCRGGGIAPVVNFETLALLKQLSK